MKKWVFLLLQKVQEPTDVASLVMLRIVFGLLMFFEIVRYFHIGWVKDVYAKPEFHFQYEWFWWLRPLPEEAMYLLFGILGISRSFLSACINLIFPGIHIYLFIRENHIQ